MRSMIIAASALAGAAGAEAGTNARLVAIRRDAAPSLRLDPNPFADWTIANSGAVTYRTPGPDYLHEIDSPGWWTSRPGEVPSFLMPLEFEAIGASWKTAGATAEDEAGARFVFGERVLTYSHAHVVLRRSADGSLALVTTPPDVGLMTSQGRYDGAYMQPLGAGRFFLLCSRVGVAPAAYVVEGSTATPVYGRERVPGIYTFSGTPRPRREGGTWVRAVYRELGQPDPTPERDGYWLFEPTRRILALGYGSPTPGVPGGAFQSFFGLAYHPEAGYLTSASYFDGPPPDAPVRRGIWRGWPDSMSLVALEGEATPLPDHDWPSGFNGHYVFGGGGDFVFQSRLDLPYEEYPRGWALFAHGPTGTRVLAESGERCISGDGVVLPQEHLTTFAVNAQGLAVAFLWTHEAGGPGGRRSTVQIVSSDREGRVRHVAREGQPIRLGTDNGVEEFVIDRIERDWSCSSGPDRTCWLNDAGELVVFMRLSRDGELHEALVTLDASTRDDCGADLNGDGVVDAADLARAISEWGPAIAGADDADLDGNLTVSAADLSLLLAAWGACSPPASDFASVVDE